MMTTTPRFMGGQLIGTITTNIGNTAPRNGFKIIELYEVRCAADKEEKD